MLFGPFSKNQNCPADQYTSVTTTKSIEPTEITTYEFTVTSYLNNFETGEVTEGDMRSLEATDAVLTSRHRTNPKFSNLEKIKNSKQGHAKVKPGHSTRRWSNVRPAESNSAGLDSNYNDVQLLKWAMNHENSDNGAPKTTIRSTTVTTQYMLNDLQYESEPEIYENPENFDFEDEYEQEFLQDDWAMMRPIQNIVNFYNGQGKQNPKIKNFDAAPRSYPINSQMMNDARASSYSNSLGKREEPQENFQMLDAKLHKRVRLKNTFPLSSFYRM